jgi:hypothetical protein
MRAGHYTHAIDHYDRALVLARRCSWLEAQAALLLNAGAAHGELGRLATAAERADAALTILPHTSSCSPPATPRSDGSSTTSGWSRAGGRTSSYSRSRASRISVTAPGAAEPIYRDAVAAGDAERLGRFQARPVRGAHDNDHGMQAWVATHRLGTEQGWIQSAQDYWAFLCAGLPASIRQPASHVQQVFDALATRTRPRWRRPAPHASDATLSPPA